MGTGTVEERTGGLSVEASAVVVTYNMVSRHVIPWRLERKDAGYSMFRF